MQLISDCRSDAFSRRLRNRPKAEAQTVSILVDLDPASADRTVIVESITADQRRPALSAGSGDGQYSSRRSENSEARCGGADRSA